MFGCVSAPEQGDGNRFSENYDNYVICKKVFIAPVGVDSEEFQSGADKVKEEVGKQLVAQNKQVVSMSSQNAQELWLNTLQSIGGIFSPISGELIQEKLQLAQKNFVLTINQKQKYSVTLIPSFVVKNAKLKTKYATWDGVQRRLSTRWPYSGLAWKGDTRALSLQLVAFDSAGNWLFTSYGGIETLFEIDDLQGDAILKPRRNIFLSNHNIEEGVGIALKPFYK